MGLGGGDKKGLSGWSFFGDEKGGMSKARLMDPGNGSGTGIGVGTRGDQDGCCWQTQSLGVSALLLIAASMQDRGRGHGCSGLLHQVGRVAVVWDWYGQ